MENWTKYFKVIGIEPGPVITHRFGLIDFSDTSLPVEKMLKLYEDKCPYLQPTKQGTEFLYGIITTPPNAFPALKPTPEVAANPKSDIISETERETNKEETPQKPIDNNPPKKTSGIAVKKYHISRPD